MGVTSVMIGGVSEIHEHVFKNDVDKVAKCLNKFPACINSRDSDGKTPLIVAASFNRCDVIEVLLTSSACDVNARDNDGNAALHEAADRGYTDVVKQLIKSGKCDTNLQNTRGETALMKAAFYDYVEISTILLKLGSADPDVKDSSGQTALLVGLREGSHMTVDELITAGCDVNITNNIGESALYVAIKSPLSRSLEPAKRLLSAGYDITIDRIWLLNEEKHSLFYQDDEFYTQLRRKLRSRDLENIDVTLSSTQGRQLNNHTEAITSQSGNARNKSSPDKSPISSPFSMSPMLKQKIMSTETFGKGSELDWSTPPTSPLHSRRVSQRSPCSTPRVRLSPMSSFDSDTFESPRSSPVPKAFPLTHNNVNTFRRQVSDSTTDTIGQPSKRSVSFSDNFNLSKLSGALAVENRQPTKSTDSVIRRQRSE